jgi:hypothetical protein
MKAFEHYGAYCKALAPKETVKGATTKYTVVGEEFKKESEHIDVVDSIRDLEVPSEGDALAYEDGQSTNIEVRKQSEIEQEVCIHTGLKRRALHPHPDGWKQDGDDGKEDIFGKVYTRVRKTKPETGGVKYVRTLPPPRPITDDVEEVEVYFAFKGNYTSKVVRADLTQEQAERMGGVEFDGNVGLIEFNSPKTDLTYRFKAMYCQNRETAVWTRCDRTDSGDEECVLFGQELSDADITRIMEDRWYTPLKMIKTTRPMENNQTLTFTKRLTRDEEEEEATGIPPLDPLALFEDRSIWTPPRPSTPGHFRSFMPEPEDRIEYTEKIMTKIIAGPHIAMLCLAKDATVERAIEILHRRTGITGKWEGRIASPGDPKKCEPRVIELTPISVQAPPNLADNLTETRIFFGTLEHKGAYDLTNQPSVTLAQAVEKLEMDQFWEYDRSFVGRNKAPPTIIARRNEPKPLIQALPETIESFIADHVEKGRRIASHKIKCKGNESPDFNQN